MPVVAAASKPARESRLLDWIAGRIRLTPFESYLLEALKAALNKTQQEVLEDQLSQFNKITRCLEDDGAPGAFGYTEFHKIRFGKPVLEFGRTFWNRRTEAELARVVVRFEGGEIAAAFKIVHGRLFSIQFRSPQRIFYPPSKYFIESIVLNESIASSQG